MDVVFEETRRFDKLMKKLGHTQQKRVAKSLNEVAEDPRISEGRFASGKLHRVNVKWAPGVPTLESAIYNLWAGGLQVILTVEADPLFDQVIMRLLWVGPTNQMHREIHRLLQTFYAEELSLAHPVDTVVG